MSIIVRVEIVDDNANQVEKTYVKFCDGVDSRDDAKAICNLMGAAFKYEFGDRNEDWE